MKRKSFIKKLVAAITAIVMALSLAPISAFAAIGDYPSESDFPEMVVNGDLMQLTGNTYVGWTDHRGLSSATEGAATFNNIAIGAADWAVGLTQEIPGVVNGANYRVTYTVKSSIGRWIKTGFDRPDGSMNYAWVQPNEETVVTYVFKSPSSGKPKFTFFLGQPTNGNVLANVDTARGTNFAGAVADYTEAHSVTISNLSFKRGYSDKEKWYMEDGEQSQGVPKNLIKNGNFAEKEEIVTDGESTTNFAYAAVGNINIYWNRYRVIFGITATAADWQQRIRATYTRPSTGTYTIGATVRSSIDRKVIFGATDGRDIALDLEAGKKQTIYYTRSLNAGTEANGYNLYLGGGATVNEVVVPAYNTHDIELFDLFVLRNDNGAALQTLVTSSDSVTNDSYTVSTWNTFQTALQDAKDLLSQSDLSQKQIDLNNAEKALQDAKDALDVQGNPAALQTLYNQYKDEVEADYTAETWSAFKKAFDKAALAISGGTQAEIDKAKEDLTVAAAALKPDKTALESLYEDNVDRDGTPYTSASWSTFDAARQNAKTVLDNNSATLANVKGAITSLQNAVAGLAPDKTALAALIVASDALVQNQYTSATWTTFASALSGAKSVNNNANATIEQIAGALSALQSAKAALNFDKTALVTLINQVKDLTKDTANGSYTESTWSIFSDALASAQSVNSNTAATWTEISGATTALQTAYAGLKPDKTALAALITASDALVQNQYISTTWTTFASALSSAKSVNNNANATIEQVAGALSALQGAKAALNFDKTALVALINQVKDLTRDTANGSYTESTWSTFSDALASAQGVNSNTAATWTEISGATTALQTAYAGLRPDKTALAALISVSDTLVQNQYTSDTWATFASALSGAKSVNNDANATLEQVAGALSALQSAKAALNFDKSVLAALINQVENLTKDTANGSYSDSSWETFSNALSSAQSVNSNIAATSTEISGAVTALQTAYNGLRPDKTTLLALCNTWKDVAQGNYTKSTWETLVEKLEAAQGVLGNEDALQAAVNSALSELQSAIDGLISTNKANLKALHDLWKDTVQGLLTDSSWAKLKAALISTETVLDNRNALQADVEAELTALTAVLGSLEYRMPTDIKVSKASATSVKVSWTKADNADGYEVWYATSENGTYNKVASTTETSLTHTGLKIGGTYYYKVLAYKTVDQVTNKSDLTAAVFIKLPVSALAAPTGIKAVSAGATSINVTWNKVNGATGYVVYRATSLNGKYSKVATVASGKTSYTNNSLTNGKTYYYKVTAISKIDGVSQESSYSSAVKIKVALVKPSIKVKAGKASVKLSWKKVAGATKYEIYRATRSNGKYKKVATVSKKVTYTNKKLKKGTKYYYKVKAVQKVGKKTYRSAFSAKKSAKAK